MNVINANKDKTYDYFTKKSSRENKGEVSQVVVDVNTIDDISDNLQKTNITILSPETALVNNGVNNITLNNNSKLSSEPISSNIKTEYNNNIEIPDQKIIGNGNINSTSNSNSDNHLNLNLNNKSILQIENNNQPFLINNNNINNNSTIKSEETIQTQELSPKQEVKNMNDQNNNSIINSVANLNLNVNEATSFTTVNTNSNSNNDSASIITSSFKNPNSIPPEKKTNFKDKLAKLKKEKDGNTQDKAEIIEVDNTKDRAKVVKERYSVPEYANNYANQKFTQRAMNKSKYLDIVRKLENHILSKFNITLIIRWRKRRKRRR